MSLKDRYIRASEKFGGPWAFKTSGVDQRTATSIMRGSIPAADKVYEVAKALRVSLEWLIAEDGEMREGVAAEAPAPYGKEGHARKGRALKPRELVVQGVAEKLTPEDLITWTSQGVHFIKSPEEQEKARKDIQALKLLWEGKKQKQQARKKNKPSTAS